MAAPVYSQVGIRLDVIGRKGADIGIFNIDATNADGSSADLSAVTFTGIITDDTGAHVGDVTFDVTSAATGVIRYWFSHSATESLDATATGSPAKYAYAIEGTFSDGLIKPMYYGELRLMQGTGK